MDLQLINNIRSGNGAQLLDQKHPGWAGKINLSTLRMSSVTRCVLGQLGYFVGYDPHLRALGLEKKSDLIGCGFVAAESADWYHLNAAWREQVRLRQ